MSLVCGRVSAWADTRVGFEEGDAMSNNQEDVTSCIAVRSTLDDEYVRFVTEAWPDPRPFYDRLRAEAPVYWTPMNHWYVSGFAEAAAIWKDNDRWSQRPVLSTGRAFDLGDGPAATFFGETLLSLDGDAHARMRGPVNQVFAPRGIEQLADTVRATVSTLMDRAASGDRMEFLHDFARPLPTTVILDVFGIDHAAYERFSEVADIIIECYEAMGSCHFADDLRVRADRTLGGCAEYVIELAHERRGGAATDLLSELVRAQDADPASMTDSELASAMMFIVTAGFETTMYTATNMVYHLLDNPGQLALVRADRSLIRSTIEEVLRYEPGVYVSSVRYATEDIEVAGKHITRGDLCLISNHAANHDPAVFEHADRFDVTRQPNRQLSFGRGRHTCLGAHLARIELRMTLEVILDRFPGLALDIAPEEINWTSSHVLRGPTSLPVRW